MILPSFRIASPRRVTASVALEPVHNALTSLALLNVPDRLPDMDAWVPATAALLSPEERRTNRLVFETLGEALIADQERPDFTSYLDNLAAQDPVSLRDRMLERLCSYATATTSPTPAGLLADNQSFAAYVARLYPGDPPDPALLSEAHTLLNHPSAMRQLIVSHLRAMWDKHLAAEWRRWCGILQAAADELNRRNWSRGAATDTIRAFIGRDLPPSIGSQLDGVEHITFVPSPHIGLHAARFNQPSKLWVFVRCRTEDLPFRQEPVKRIELVGPLNALADETRLRILQLLAPREEMLAQELIAQLGLSQSSVSRHLKQLTATGYLIERRSDGANKSYRLNPRRLDWTFLTLKSLLSESNIEAEAVQAAQRATEEATRAEQPAELRRYLDLAGRVARWPNKFTDQRRVVAYLATRFEVGREYTEREVNALLNQWHTFGDPVTLRRELYDDHLIDRTRDGARYWLVADRDAPLS